MNDHLPRSLFPLRGLCAALAILLLATGCTFSRQNVVGAPDPADRVPRPAKVDRSYVGPAVPDEPADPWKMLLLIPALFFAGVSVPDDVVMGPIPTMILPGQFRQRQWERLDDDWLPPKTEEALQRAFSGATPYIDPLADDRLRKPGSNSLGKDQTPDSGSR